MIEFVNQCFVSLILRFLVSNHYFHLLNDQYHELNHQMVKKAFEKYESLEDVFDDSLDKRDNHI